jgi:microcystin-dependent protein
MGQPYVGEIRLMGCNFAPAGWASCAGQQMPIAENDVLFQLIGTTYGGDGQENFNLPDLQSRVPVGVGAGHPMAEAGGVESVTLALQQIAIHNHVLFGSTAQATTNNASGNIPATMLAAGTSSAYGSTPPFKAINQASIGSAGGNQPHSNLQPYLTLNFVISLFGIYPSPT